MVYLKWNQRFYLFIVILMVFISPSMVMADEKPNILWITCEDLSLVLGCYGDTVAYTPNLDRFAEGGVRYANAFATAPLCTPARSSLITGVFASSMGTHHLRGVVPKSTQIECFTRFLREQGYYCSNNVKEDYNFPTPKDAWDESSNTAHWRGRKEGQPFFSVFNFMTTHQSQTRYTQDKLDEVNKTLKPEERVDKEKIIVPPYYPDTPVVRTNLAALYTQVTLMDKQFQAILDQLEDDGLRENTIIFFYSDHGTGLPRGKRWVFDSGLQVPLIIDFPKKYKHLSPSGDGKFCHDLVCFADFSATVLSLVGIEPPDYMQGQAFLGQYKKPARKYVMAIRDRVDEVLMFSRSIRGKRFHYIRNFMPHRARMQRSFFSEMTPIRQEIRQLHKDGKLKWKETWLMDESIPVDELYDTLSDPNEFTNLADDPDYEDVLNEMKRDLFNWMIESKDLGLIPEYEMLTQSKDQSPYDVYQPSFDPKPLLALVDKVGRGNEYLSDLTDALTHKNPTYRYWGATGLAALGWQARPAKELLQHTLQDPSPCVRFVAAEAVCKLGDKTGAIEVLTKGLLDENVVNQLHASQILMVIGDAAKKAIPEMKIAVERLKDAEERGWYTRENLEFMLKKFGEM
jgi:N-sulfoglucosamine sulfohydrolase